VNRKTGRFKHELTESLRTSDNSVARSRAGLLISDSEFLVREMRRFLSEGAPRTLSPDVTAYLAERRPQPTHKSVNHSSGLNCQQSILDSSQGAAMGFGLGAI